MKRGLCWNILGCLEVDFSGKVCTILDSTGVFLFSLRARPSSLTPDPWLGLGRKLEVCLFYFKDILCVWVFCMGAYLCTTSMQCPHKSEDGMGSLGTGVLYVSHYVGAGNCTPVLWKSSQCSLTAKTGFHSVTKTT